MKPSQEHQRDVDALVAFREAYAAVVDSAEQRPDSLVIEPGFTPKVDHQRWSALTNDVARLSGPADLAYRRNAGLFTLKRFGQVQPGFSPVANWMFTLEHPYDFPPTNVVQAVESGIGVAQAKAAAARDRERGVTGLLAGFLRWPADLRDAVGPGHVQRRAATTVGVIGQIGVAVFASATAAALIAGVVALWHVAV